MQNFRYNLKKNHTSIDNQIYIHVYRYIRGEVYSSYYLPHKVILFFVSICHNWDRISKESIRGSGVGWGSGSGEGLNPSPRKIQINFHINLPKIGRPPPRQHNPRMRWNAKTRILYTGLYLPRVIYIYRV